MRRYAFSPAFKTLVDDSLIQVGDINPPAYLFRMRHEEFIDWRYCGWSTVISVDSLDEAMEIVSKLEEGYEISCSEPGNSAGRGETF